ncbi:Chorismate mutase I / Prephenate dehydratase [hydrothermal vent metagenome]|uniref:Bifunctional chorismate mutase/prephenate dehydratase n=1 Tax=hydrothermal vent metagenome TaxID=652676 RepID=A0A3B1DT26_9ZZZZ
MAKKQTKKTVKKKASIAKSRTTKSVSKKKPATRKVVKRKVETKKQPVQKKNVSLESQIRTLDKEILKAVNQRVKLTTRSLQSSPNPAQELFKPRTDDDLWNQLEKMNNGPLSATAVRSIFREMISTARRQVKVERVAYLGPAYSFTHLAAIERFGSWVDLIPVSTIAAVFEEVNRGHCTFGLVPIENSTDGRIVDTLDMFTRLPLRICGEVQIEVHHNLLARCPRSEIVEIYSKPQALSQCREWLAKNMPHARLIEVTSTSTAAQLARDKHGAAAIASQQAAKEYDLLFVAECIEDNSNNITRFAVIGEEETKPTGKDRTAILLQISHKPGALNDSLLTFKKNKINLTWIESFPLRGPESGYLFFLDFEGHVSEPRVKRAITELQKNAVRLEVLGSYPQSEPRE